jgi:hypothetical protein
MEEGNLLFTYVIAYTNTHKVRLDFVICKSRIGLFGGLAKFSLKFFYFLPCVKCEYCHDRRIGD